VVVAGRSVGRFVDPFEDPCDNQGGVERYVPVVVIQILRRSRQIVDLRLDFDANPGRSLCRQNADRVDWEALGRTAVEVVHEDHNLLAN
jgi:hypothetical protein